jgi:hypothetical protein
VTGDGWRVGLRRVAGDAWRVAGGVQNYQWASARAARWETRPPEISKGRADGIIPSSEDFGEGLRPAFAVDASECRMTLR